MSESGLGPLVSIHRRRRPVAVGAWVSGGIATGLLTLVGWGAGGWGGALVLFSVSVALIIVGVTGFVYLAPAEDLDGRRAIAVHERGLLFRRRRMPPEPVAWSRLTLTEPEPGAPPWKRSALRYPRDEEGEATVYLDGYSAKGGLLRAVRSGTSGGAPRPAFIPVWRRPLAASVAGVIILAAVAVVSVQAWDPGPPAPPTSVELRKICEDPGEPHPGAAPYAGPGPHPVAVYLAKDTGRVYSEPWSESPTSGPYPDGWRGEPSEAQLVVCVLQQPDLEIANCGDYAINPNLDLPFGRVSSVRAYLRSYQMRVYEAAAGRELLSTRVGPANAFACPDEIVAQQQGLTFTAADLIHEPTIDDFVDALDDLVTGEAPATD